MSFLRKINPDANDTIMNVSQNQAGCCEGTTICGYTATLTGGSYSNIVFTNSKGVSTTATFENTATDAATLKAELRKVFVKSELNGGLGTYEHGDDWQSIIATDNGGDVDLFIVTDVTLATISSQALTEDCTTQTVCECKFTVEVGADVSAYLLSYNGSGGTALATGTYTTGQGGTLDTEVTAALATESASVDTVVVTEDTDLGVFTVTIRLKDTCDKLTWNSVKTENCGCAQEFHQ